MFACEDMHYLSIHKPRVLTEVNCEVLPQARYITMAAYNCYNNYSFIEQFILARGFLLEYLLSTCKSTTR